MTSGSQHTAFEAIADPTRRAILALLAIEPASVELIAGHFPISRPAISKHLRIMLEARLVRREARGRTNLYTLDPGPLAEIRDWIDGLWRERLGLLKRLAEGDA